MGCAESKDSENGTSPSDRRRYRTCTDTIWLGIYTIFWIFLIVIASYAFKYGNPFRIIYGYDSFGNTCGVEKNERYENLPLSGMNTLYRKELFYFSLTNLKDSLKICVRKCPPETMATSKEMYEYSYRTDNVYCRYDFKLKRIRDAIETSNENEFFNITGPCPSLPIVKSSSVFYRCVPNEKAAANAFYKMLDPWEIAHQILADIYAASHYIRLMCFIAILISVVLVMLMHCLTRLVSWLICILVAAASIFLTFVSWVYYYDVHERNAINPQISTFEQFLRNENTLFILAIIATVTMIILLVIIYFLKNKLSGLSALFQEAGACMMNLHGLFIAPLLALIVFAIFLAFWVIVVLCITTASSPGQSPFAPFDNTADHAQIQPGSDGSLYEKNETSILRTIEFTDAKAIRSMFWIYVIGFIWTTEFIFACLQFTLASAVAFWYFEKPTSTPTLYAIGKLIKYHLGTVAKGSFIITIFKIPRLILTYLYAKLKKSEDDGSNCATCCLKCCICFFWMLEKFIKFLNHNAYTVVAIESINFCPAAGIAWDAMATNVLQVATINSVGDMVLFLGKVLVTAICGIIGYVLVLGDVHGLNFSIAPVIVIVIFSFFIAHIILSLFEMVVDTLFLCVCEDKKINGRGGRWARSNLAKLVGEEPLQPGEEPSIQVLELMPINKQPFRTTEVDDEKE